MLVSARVEEGTGAVWILRPHVGISPLRGARTGPVTGPASRQRGTSDRCLRYGARWTAVRCGASAFRISCDIWFVFIPKKAQ